jgi:hypothetical protein
VRTLGHPLDGPLKLRQLALGDRANLARREHLAEVENRGHAYVLLCSYVTRLPCVSAYAISEAVEGPT